MKEKNMKIHSALTFRQWDRNDDAVSCSNPQAVGGDEESCDSYKGEAQLASPWNSHCCQMFTESHTYVTKMLSFVFSSQSNEIQEGIFFHTVQPM